MGEIALEELEIARKAGVLFDCVTADAEYGKAAAFRQGLSGRRLRYAVGIQPQQFVYAADVELFWPDITSRGDDPESIRVPPCRECVLRR